MERKAGVFPPGRRFPRTTSSCSSGGNPAREGRLLCGSPSNRMRRRATPAENWLRTAPALQELLLSGGFD